MYGRRPIPLPGFRTVEVRLFNPASNDGDDLIEKRIDPWIGEESLEEALGGAGPPFQIGVQRAQHGDAGIVVPYLLALLWRG